eukprot:scaffold303229_cov16-Prasinocladus_malaysianus.AAC.1
MSSAWNGQWTHLQVVACAQVGGRKLPDRLGPCGGEAEGLALAWKRCKDLLDLPIKKNRKRIAVSEPITRPVAKTGWIVSDVEFT